MKVSYYYNPVLKYTDGNCYIDICMYKNGKNKVVKTLEGKYETYWKLLLNAKRMVEYMNIHFTRPSIFNQSKINGLYEYLNLF